MWDFQSLGLRGPVPICWTVQASPLSAQAGLSRPQAGPLPLDCAVQFLNAGVSCLFQRRRKESTRWGESAVQRSGGGEGFWGPYQGGRFCREQERRGLRRVPGTLLLGVFCGLLY